jgi:hypothetical protein
MTPTPEEVRSAVERLGYYTVCAAPPGYDPVPDIEIVLAAHAQQQAKVEGYQRECNEVEQTLGAALGMPWFKDDQKNFPGATEADGVCVGEHIPATIAMEAAQMIAQQQAMLERVLPHIQRWYAGGDPLADEIAAMIRKEP